MPAQHRVGLIEDTAELQLKVDNLFRFEARREQAGLPAITIRDLLRAALRHRPDRILVGEVRGGEAFDLLQALNTGHAGSLSTIHANGTELALRRFTSCVLQSGVDVPYPAIRYGLAECLQVLVHLERRDDRRLVTELVRVRRYNPGTDTYDLESL
jgi:pilus assembly protein CpaF